ncbi:MAG: cellulose biosynthesis protein BcsC [Enterobacteriaceae bacterium]|nr:cellulose biosynthesis protein BcsC [Enterobacteriaceae bacterium]
MRTLTLRLLALSLGIALMPKTYAAPTAQQQQLLEQVRLGESTRREDLVRQSLYRLELIDPNNPEVIAARQRYLLRQGDTAGAQQQLDRLAQLAPNSAAYREAQSAMTLSTAQGRQGLQEARLLATTGHTAEAIAAYDKLLQGNPPESDLAAEYWTLVAKVPERRSQAITQLKSANDRYPGNPQLQNSLAQLLFASGRSDEGYTVLRQMAKSGTTREAAAAIWYQQIQNMPVSDASVQALQQFLNQFSDGDTVETARATLAKQQQQLADPAFRARSRGLAAVDAGQGGQAIASLQQALNADQNDGETTGALGQAYSQKGDRARAVPLLEKAIALAPQSSNRSKWDSLLQTNRYWLLIQQGDAALKANNPAQAERLYQQARAVDNTDSYAVLGLGDAAVARKDSAAAERYYQQALRMDSGNSNAIRGLANLYREQSPEKASAWIAALPASQRRSVDDIERSLANDRLAQQAETLENQGRWAQAAEIQRRRLASDPDSVWIAYRLSRDLWSAGQHAEADAQMRDLVRRQPNDPTQVYAYSLYLSGNDQDRAALAHLSTLPRSKWDSNMQELASRLEGNQLLETANRLRDSGKEAEAEALLKQQPASTRIDLTLADWAQQRGDYATARAGYETVLAREPANGDARLSLVEVAIAEGNPLAARQQLAAMNEMPQTEPPSINMQRRMALVRSQLGDKVLAQRTYDTLVPEAKALPPSQDSALVLRDYARFQQANGQPQLALTSYNEAMVAAGIAPVPARDNDTFTRQTRNDASDDWLKRGLRSDAADLYRQQDLNVTLEHDYWGSSGTGGYSDLKANTTMLQADAPLADGRMFFRTDVVNMDVGSFATDENGLYDPNWGTCGQLNCVNGDKSQSDGGASIAVGWRNDTNDRGGTGKTWGGVRSTGGGVSLSYDQGEAHGVWASLSADTLTGKNVDDNWRVRWMSGYYYKLVNEDNRRVTVGLNNMLWHYDKDLSGYSLGQGGYYSPQKYLSFAVPVTWRERTENWSWELGGSVSWSHSATSTQATYPKLNLIPDTYRARAADEKEFGSKSNGFGYTARALIERRITSNWSVGAAIDIQQAEDYTPSHGMLYVRYSQAGWQGDMDSPPQVLTPYADW